MPFPKRKREVHIAFEQDEWAVVLSNADEAEIEWSKYLVKAALNCELKVVDENIFKDSIERIETAINKLTFAINRYGHNLNQVKIIAHTTGSIFERDVIKLQDDIIKIKAEVFDAIENISFKEYSAD